jgi:hypothetical protein
MVGDQQEASVLFGLGLWVKAAKAVRYNHNKEDKDRRRHVRGQPGVNATPRKSNGRCTRQCSDGIVVACTCQCAFACTCLLSRYPRGLESSMIFFSGTVRE